MIRVELRKLFRRPRTYVIIGAAVRAAVPRRGVPGHHADPAAARPGRAFLSAVLSNGALFPAAAMALVLPVFLPVAVAVLGR